MRFDARHIGSGVWGVFDAGVMGWRATDLGEDEALQQAADLNVVYNQYGQREQVDRLEVKPPIEVESATWSVAGTLDQWVKRNESGEAVCVMQTAIRHGSELLIFVCRVPLISSRPATRSSLLKGPLP
jgi:hypothetical protein